MNEYWRQREEQAQREYRLTEEEYIEELNGIYDYMLDRINEDIRSFYSRYASREGITYAEATERVSNTVIEEYERKAKKYVEEHDFSAQANEEMRIYNLTMRVNRLETLKAEIGLEMVSGFDELDKVLGEDLTERAVQEMARQSGILGMTVKDTARTANSIVGASFHNATFSERIWMYQDELKSQLDILLRQGLIQGRGPRELADQILRRFDVSRNEAERLMRTELCRVQTEAQKQSFIANGFDEYQYNALSTACPVCRALDEKHFKIVDMMPGENAPPMHPNCFCATSAYMDDATYNEWLDTYQNHGMSFEDWLNNRLDTAVEPETNLSEDAQFIADWATKENVAYNAVQKLDRELTDDEIIDKISGGDETGGSCSSLALAYIANEHGLDVTDFRGGESRYMFSTGQCTRRLKNMAGDGGVIVQAKDHPLKEAGQAITQNVVGEGKTYYLGVGKHAAVVKRVTGEDGKEFIQYLELQGAKYEENGWARLTTNVLNSRFGVTKNARTCYGDKLATPIEIIDSEALTSNPEFQTIMGYINTNANEQQKGASGYAK